VETHAERIGTPQTQGLKSIQMNVFHLVNRDSYLPQGSRGLTAVTRTLLGLEPEEIRPEEMIAAASERSHETARYFISDAVCAYILYMTCAHPSFLSR
jgi:DNA polymerase epsilon subunit 1